MLASTTLPGVFADCFVDLIRRPCLAQADEDENDGEGEARGQGEPSTSGRPANGAQLAANGQSASASYRSSA